mmetsp:Transcript_46593/g.122326  ORF Transcript_46593/g.122326 Transcript_46593/m.122326 type:complete len:1040 (-) Transcript_46593:517-3636(-)
MLLLKDDAEIMSKGLRISLDAAGVAASSTAGSRAAAAEASVDVGELAAELVAEAGDGTSAEAVAARWDTGTRRSLFDRAIIGRLSDSDGSYAVADYLIGCYSRCVELRSRKGSAVTEELGEIFGHVTDLCVSYASIALLNPEMFPQPAAVEVEGVLRMLGPLKTDSLPTGFLARMVARLQEDGTLAEFGLPLFQKLAEELADKKVNILSHFTPAFSALNALVREKPLGALLAHDGNFLGGPLARNGALLQMGSRLGPFFSLSAFPAEPALAAEFFPDTSNPHSLEATMSSLRMSSGVVQRALTSIAKELLKNADAKERFFQLLASSCTLNHSRAQQWFPHAESQRLMHAIAPQHIEPPGTVRTYSLDGFMFNLAGVLLSLCDPFTAPDSPHASKIDPSYLLSTHRLDLKDETRLCATTDDVMYWLDSRNPDLRQRYLDRLAAEGVVAPDADDEPLQVSASFGTISEYFFLTMRVLHVGLLPSYAMLEKLSKEHQRWASDLHIREQELMRLRTAGQHGSAITQQLEAEAAQLKKWIDAVKQCILGYQTQLSDPALVASCVRYYRLVSRWLVATAAPPAEGLPLPDKVPRLFAALPEFCMSDVAEFLKYVSHLAPHAFEQMDSSELYDFVTLMVTFIGAPKYVKNPYLRATFTKLLCYLVPQTDDTTGRRHASDRLAAVFHSHALAQRHLAPAIMQFFVDIEFTGSHTSAYDKYEYRHEMSQILQYFWSTPVYKATMVEFARNRAKFVRFVNMLINDAIYSMNEALTKLATIKETQAEMADEHAWAQQPPRVRQQRAQEHQQNEGHARYFMVFTSEVLNMVQYLSSEAEIAEIFMLPELAPRMAEMLNHFLVELVGPKCANLKVKDMGKYNFQPVQLLGEIIATVLHFAPFSSFEVAMVRDERSFDPNNLRKAVRVLSKHAFEHQLRPEQLHQLEQFASRCIEVKEREAEAEAELGEVPDEFLDPITASLMDDPVKLPSGHSVDRAVISRHLLSDETDPFSRQRCTVDMLVDDTELKVKIEAWKAERKAAMASGAAPMEEG